MTTLSIVTVVLNDLPGLTRTAASLAFQIRPEFEWIVIDGASTGEHRVNQKSLTAIPTVFISEPDAGIYDAMNKGWRRASGDWVLFLNAGDTLCHDRTLEDVIPRLEESRADWAFGMVRNVDHHGNVIGIQNASPFNRMGHALGNTTVPHQATFMRTKLIEELNGFNPQFGMAADQELIYRAARKGPPVELVWPICDFRMGGKGMEQSALTAVRGLRAARKAQDDYLAGSDILDRLAVLAVMGKRFAGNLVSRMDR